jgi:hypothetical protein
MNRAYQGRHHQPVIQAKRPEHSSSNICSQRCSGPREEQETKSHSAYLAAAVFHGGRTDIERSGYITALGCHQRSTSRHPGYFIFYRLSEQRAPCWGCIDRAQQYWNYFLYFAVNFGPCKTPRVRLHRPAAVRESEPSPALRQNIR